MQGDSRVIIARRKVDGMLTVFQIIRIYISNNLFLRTFGKVRRNPTSGGTRGSNAHEVHEADEMRRADSFLNWMGRCIWGCMGAAFAVDSFWVACLTSAGSE